MSQLAIPVDLPVQEIARKRSLGEAITLCVDASDFEPKNLQVEFGWDKGQWSRWISGDEGIKWPKLEQVMDHCGNDAPVLWMLYQRGYDLHALRKRESELERDLRLVREENAALRRVLIGGK